MEEVSVDIKTLAKLARVEISDEESARLEKEIPTILKFVETIQKVSGDAPKDVSELRNVMREDGNPHESGVHTQELLQAAPQKKDDRISVQQVISRKK